MTTIKDFDGYSPTWCPGCGDWGIGAAIKQALVQLNFDPSSVGVVFDIGCSSNMSDFLNAYAIHSLHGRAIPSAIGMKLANHKLPVIVVGGDGGIYGEGGNHFLHACRGNHDITVIVHDNGVYGLTTGQAAPTASQGTKSKSTPLGTIETAINPLTLALTQGATFVANTLAGDVMHLISMIKEGINHEGFSLINILQPCVTFNKSHTYKYYAEHSYKLEESHDKSGLNLAISKSLEIANERFPLGVLYQINKSPYHKKLPQLEEDVSLIGKSKFEGLEALIEGFI